MSNDPIHQFHINPISSPINIGGVDATFTNASLFMVAGVAVASTFMIAAMRPAAMVPGRSQNVAEIAYGFIRNMVKDAGGEEAVKRFFPFVFTLFIFIFMANMLGMFPYWFAPTSQIVITATMALMVFFTVLIIGFAKNGLKFLKLFVPSGIPVFILPLVVFIEVFSFFLRPVSHSIRLFANMLAGHIALKVFAGFIPLLAAGLGVIGWIGGTLPLGMVIALTALELLVAFLQAYVFTILTCIYLNDAIHPGH